MDYAYKVTTHGRAVIAACMALEAPFHITRVAFGSGRVEEETNLADVHQLLEYVSDGAEAGKRHQDDRFELTIQYANSEHKEVPTFLLSEFIVYVEDPATGEETDLLYGTLGDYRQPVPAYNPAYPPSVFNFPLTLILSDEISVVVSAPAGLVTWDDFSKALGDINPISNSGIPTSSTAGIVGQKYINTDSGAVYTCITAELPEGADAMRYTWVPGSLGTLEEIRAALSNKVDLSLISNDNILDNAYFVGGGSQQGGGQFPINQRASVAYGSGNGEYFIDRWRINGSCELMPDGLLLKPATLICQFFEEQLKQYLDGKLVTASIWFEDGTYYFGSSVYHKASSANTTLCSLPGAFEALIGSDGNFFIQADYTSVDGIKPGAVKLELGSTPTLAHQDTSGNWVLNDPLPNFALELAKCQRNQVVFHDCQVIGIGFATGVSPMNEQTVHIQIPLPTSLHAFPSLIGAGNLNIFTENWYARRPVTSLRIDHMAPNCLACSVVYSGDALNPGTNVALVLDSDSEFIIDSNI